MKQSTVATKVMIGALCLGVLLYLGIYFLLGFRDEVATTPAYSYTVEVGVEASGVIVRSERLLTSSGAYVDLVLSEGERAAAGSAVALIYSDPSAPDTRQKIRALEAELEQLRHALLSGTESVNASRLDEEVLRSIVSLRALCAEGDLTNLEDSVLNLRTMVFRRDYTYGDTDAAQQLSQTIKGKEEELSALQRSLSQVSQTVRTPVSGVFSGEADGYESLITPEMLSTVTVARLSDLLSQKAPAKPDAVGKIITDTTWYLAALFEGSNDLALSKGKTYQISFSHDYYGTVPMKLERVETEDGKTMAIFSSRTKLAETTLLRVQAVDIVARELTGIRVPRKALRVETRTVTAEDGTQRQENVYGVYSVVGTRAEWHSVNVLYTGDTFYLVEPVNDADKNRLRPGDLVILTSAGLYDGKVVLQ